MTEVERDGASAGTDAESQDGDAESVGTDAESQDGDAESVGTDAESGDGEVVETDDGHLERIDDGCGCVGVWEALSEDRESETAE